MKRFGLAVLGLCVAAFAQENLALWSKYKVIAVNTKASGANVAGTVTKIPVLVRLDSVNAPDVFASASAGGADIRFSNAAGTAQRPFEIEYWNKAAKKAAIWVLPDSVKGNDSLPVLRMYWGRSDASPGSKGPAVFDTLNGFVGVWHLGNSVASNPRPSSVAGAPVAILRNYGTTDSAVQGVIGLADTLRGGATASDPAGGNYIELGRDVNYNNNNYRGFTDFTPGFAYSIWFYESGNVGFGRLIQMSSDSDEAINGGPGRILFMIRQSNANVATRWNGIASYNTTSPTYTTATWTHAFFTKDSGSSTVVNTYINGALVGSSAAGDAPGVQDRNLVFLGRSLSPSNGMFQGVFDEPVLAKKSRSADFVKLSYETQKPTAAAVVLASTQSQTVTATAVGKLGYVDTLKAADTLNYLVGKAISVSAIVRGGPADSFKVVSGTLPAGLTVAKANGLLSGTATAAAAASDIVVRVWGHAAAGDSVSRTVRIATFAQASLNYAPDSIVSNINVAITALTPTYAGATPTYSVSPALPTGLTLNATTGVISGTPTVASAMNNYTVKAKTFLDSTTKVIRIRIIDPTSINGLEGIAGAAFSAKASAQGILFRVSGIASGEKASLSLMDMSGTIVYNGAFQGGSLNWNGKASNGQSASSGIYVARVKIMNAEGRMRKVSEYRVPFAR